MRKDRRVSVEPDKLQRGGATLLGLLQPLSGSLREVVLVVEEAAILAAIVEQILPIRAFAFRER
jgi:hypothetical protein